jgi:hypothetical protein
MALTGLVVSFGCSSAYDSALKDLSLPADQRMRVRIDELLRCADHTLRSLDQAASLYRDSSRDSAHQAKLESLLNAAEAGAFQLQRRGLSVHDAARAMSLESDPRVTRLLQSVDESRAAVNQSVTAMRWRKRRIAALKR